MATSMPNKLADLKKSCSDYIKSKVKTKTKTKSANDSPQQTKSPSPSPTSSSNDDEEKKPGFGQRVVTKLVDFKKQMDEAEKQNANKSDMQRLQEGNRAALKAVLGAGALGGSLLLKTGQWAHKQAKALKQKDAKKDSDANASATNNTSNNDSENNQNPNPNPSPQPQPNNGENQSNTGPKNDQEAKDEITRSSSNRSSHDPNGSSQKHDETAGMSSLPTPRPGGG